MLKFTIKSTGAGSDKYGTCEICRKHCAEVFQQRKEQEYRPGQFCYISIMFGHQDCLVSQRPS